MQSDMALVVQEYHDVCSHDEEVSWEAFQMVKGQYAVGGLDGLGTRIWW